MKEKKKKKVNLISEQRLATKESGGPVVAAFLATLFALGWFSDLYLHWLRGKVTTSDVLLFIPDHSHAFFFLLCVTLFILFWLLFTIIKDRFYKLKVKKVPILIAISILLVSTSLLLVNVLYLSGDYEFVTAEKIYLHRQKTNEVKSYTWDEVTSVNGEVHHIKTNWDYYYILHFKDGGESNLGNATPLDFDSLMFINNILREKHILFTIKTITDSDLNKMQKEFDPQRFEQIKTIFKQ